ncbi:MAG TPA: helix-turn-helix domain-containing protein [Candidatus Cybelea sp.]|nr:helix-turn-helix domain-containing protein [Candidatus Cybelea sp.]
MRRLSLFSGASETSIQDLLSRVAVVGVGRHQLAAREGTTPQNLMVAISGRLALLTQVPGDQPVVIGIVGRDELVMPSVALAGAPYPLSARAVEDVRIALIPLAELWSVAARDHGFALELARLAGGEWQTLLALLKDYRLRSAPQRFAAYLVRLAHESGRPQIGAAEVALADDRKTLASLLGMTPENLSRTIAQFRERGVVVSGRNVAIADLGTLAAFAGIETEAPQAPGEHPR